MILITLTRDRISQPSVSATIYDARMQPT